MTLGNCIIYTHGAPTFDYNSTEEIPNPLNGYLFRVSGVQDGNWNQFWKIDGIDQTGKPTDVMLKEDELKHNLRLACLKVADLQEGILHSAYLTCQSERYAEARRKRQADLAIPQQQLALRPQESNDPHVISKIFGMIFSPVQRFMNGPQEEKTKTENPTLSPTPAVPSQPTLSIRKLPPHIQIFRTSLEEMDKRQIYVQIAGEESLTPCPVDKFISQFPRGCSRFLELEAQQPPLDNEIISGIEKINQYLKEQGVFLQMPQVVRSLDETSFTWFGQPDEVAKLGEADRELLRLFDDLKIPWRLQPEDLSECGPLIESLVEEVSSCQILSTWRFDKYALSQQFKEIATRQIHIQILHGLITPRGKWLS